MTHEHEHEHAHADRSVRLAWPADAGAIAAVQVAAWRAAYAELLPADVLDALPQDEFAQTWERSITRPGDARQRVLVALERNVLRGFVTTSPSPDPDADQGRDAELGDLVVHPDALRQGHGSRMLHAAVDTLRADHFTHARTWVASTDDAVRRFLTDQGWAADGAYRELDLTGDGSVRLRQVRLHTDLRE